MTHRIANPRFALATDRATVEDDLDRFTCALLKNDPKWCAGDPSPSFSQPPRQQRQPAGARGGNAAAGSSFFRNTNAGIRLWLDWFGDGKPVSREIANARAEVCRKCDSNQKGNLLEQFTAAAGREILAIFNALHDLDLHTPADKELFVCKICSCPLKAKVWAPLEMVKKHMA